MKCQNGQTDKNETKEHPEHIFLLVKVYISNNSTSSCREECQLRSIRNHNLGEILQIFIFTLSLNKYPFCNNAQGSYSEPCQTSKMELFAEIVEGLKEIAKSQNSSFLDVRIKHFRKLGQIKNRLKVGYGQLQIFQQPKQHH